jgi:hypothetical protein
MTPTSSKTALAVDENLEVMVKGNEALAVDNEGSDNNEDEEASGDMRMRWSSSTSTEPK